MVTLEPGPEFKPRYEVLEELGKGRFGVVHKVIDKVTNQKLAAKFIKCRTAKDKDKVQDEIDIMNLLRHQKLLQLAAAFENPREIIMVTEYISGGELFERVVADDFTLTEKDCILFMRQICEGVAYMHTQNIVHLDLKPENIMCHTRTSHEIKIIDFGLAQKLNPDVPVRVLFGTPEFVPPEVINYEPIGVESDLWSIGVICYVLLSGLSPFMGDNDAETFANITRADFDFEDEAFNTVSQHARDFIAALLVKRKEERLSADQCLKHIWLDPDNHQNTVVLCTDKLKKFIIRRKWQKTGNAIRALGRMANLSASRRNSNNTSTPNSPRHSISSGNPISRMSSLNEEDSSNENSLTPTSNTVIENDNEETNAKVKNEDEIVEDKTKLNDDVFEDQIETTNELIVPPNNEKPNKELLEFKEESVESEIELVSNLSDNAANKVESLPEKAPLGIEKEEERIIDSEDSLCQKEKEDMTRTEDELVCNKSKACTERSDSGISDCSTQYTSTTGSCTSTPLLSKRLLIMEEPEYQNDLEALNNEITKYTSRHSGMSSNSSAVSEGSISRYTSRSNTGEIGDGLNGNGDRSDSDSSARSRTKLSSKIDTYTSNLQGKNKPPSASDSLKRLPIYSSRSVANAIKKFDNIDGVSTEATLKKTSIPPVTNTTNKITSSSHTTFKTDSAISNKTFDNSTLKSTSNVQKTASSVISSHKEKTGVPATPASPKSTLKPAELKTRRSRSPTPSNKPPISEPKTKTNNITKANGTNNLNGAKTSAKTAANNKTHSSTSHVETVASKFANSTSPEKPPLTTVKFRCPSPSLLRKTKAFMAKEQSNDYYLAKNGLGKECPDTPSKSNGDSINSTRKPACPKSPSPSKKTKPKSESFQKAAAFWNTPKT